MATGNENAPVYRLTLGRVQGAIFAREHNGRTYYSVSLTAYWRDEKQGQWRQSSNFEAADLGNLAAVADSCQRWIIRRIEVAGAGEK